MNLVAHFFLDRLHPSPMHIVGTISPDLVSIFDSKRRIKENKLLKNPPKSNLPEYDEFYGGVNRHFYMDKVFHISPFFIDNTREINKHIHQLFPNEEIPRSFFVSHILVELLMDKIILQRYPHVISVFYSYFKEENREKIYQLTEVVAGVSLENYPRFLGKFCNNQVLEKYTHWKDIVYVIKRVLRKVRVPCGSHLDTPEFLQIMKDAEKAISLGIWSFIDKYEYRPDTFGDRFY